VGPVYTVEQPKMRDGGQISFPIVPRFARVARVQERIIEVERNDFDRIVFHEGNGDFSFLLEREFGHPENEPSLPLELENSGVENAFDFHLRVMRENVLRFNQRIQGVSLG
jgi:hypothetical protein